VTNILMFDAALPIDMISAMAITMVVFLIIVGIGLLAASFARKTTKTKDKNEESKESTNA